MILQFEMFSILMYFKMYVIGKTVFFAAITQFFSDPQKTFLSFINIE